MDIGLCPHGTCFCDFADRVRTLGAKSEFCRNVGVPTVCGRVRTCGHWPWTLKSAFFACGQDTPPPLGGCPLSADAAGGAERKGCLGDLPTSWSWPLSRLPVLGLGALDLYLGLGRLPDLGLGVLGRLPDLGLGVLDFRAPESRTGPHGPVAVALGSGCYSQRPYAADACSSASLRSDSIASA